MSGRTDLEMGFILDAGAGTAIEDAPESVVAGGQTFPSRWHADRYIEDMKRELAELDDQLAAEDLEETKRAELETFRRDLRTGLERFETA